MILLRRATFLCSLKIIPLLSVESCISLLPEIILIFPLKLSCIEMCILYECCFGAAITPFWLEMCLWDPHKLKSILNRIHFWYRPVSSYETGLLRFLTSFTTGELDRENGFFDSRSNWRGKRERGKKMFQNFIIYLKIKE